MATILILFFHFGVADEAGFAGPNNTRVEIDPGTTWGYGLAVGLHRSEDTRVELEASWKGSSAKANTKGASDLEIGYYSLMINAYKEYEAFRRQLGRFRWSWSRLVCRQP